MRAVTERAFRMREFADAKVEDYEFREDGKVVRKDRWETGILKIASILKLVRGDWEISEVVQAVEELSLVVNPKAICPDQACLWKGRRSELISHESGLLCPNCSELVEKFKSGGAPA